jgi:hypothetical protein
LTSLTSFLHSFHCFHYIGDKYYITVFSGI